MKSHPLGGCWREKRSPPKTGIEAESVAQGGTPGRSSGANPTPTRHGEPPCALLQPPPAQNPPKLGPAPAAAGWWPPPGGEFGPKCALWHPGRDRPWVAEATGAHVSWLRALPARRLPWACKPPARPAGVQAACSPPPAPQLAPENPRQHLEGQQRGRASRRPRRLITYSRLAPNRFHLESGEARGEKGCPRQRRQAIGI